jgi:hypothetical protein
MDTAQAPIEAAVEQNVDMSAAQGSNQPGFSGDVTPKQAMPEDIAKSLSGYDIKAADLTALGVESLSGKYKTVGDLEKAYTHLQQRFGSFSGAPDEYEIPEGIEAGDWVKDWAKDSNLSQEGLSSLLEKYNEQTTAQQNQYYEAELQKLGPNADARLDNLRDWGKANNINEDVMADMFASAAHVEALESLMKGTSVQAPVDTQMQQPALTKDYLNEITNAKDDYGRKKVESNPEYAKWVQDQWARSVG